jgi:signal transduction histidine kinase/CheY-like chemotaxis protein
MNSINNWDRQFVELFNDTYNSYLNNVSPIAFINNYLDKLIKITDSESAYFATINMVDNKKTLIIEAIANKFLITETELHFPTIKYIDIESHNQSLFYKAILTNNTIITNDAKNDPSFLNIFKKYTDVQTYACIPFIFNNEVLGVIGLTNRIIYNNDTIEQFKILSHLTGTLYYNYKKCKKITQEIESRYIKYKILEEIINILHEGIIITDQFFNIIYRNQYVKILTDSLNVENEKDNILTLFPELNQLIMSEDGNAKIYKNKKVELNMNENLTLELLLNSAIVHNSIYTIIIIKDISETLANDQLVKKNQNNFVAFLSHELRNPLQSITLSNYLLQNKIKTMNIDDKTSTQLHTINKACNDMKKIINDILDLSKIEANEFQIEMDICEIKEIADDVINEYSHTAEGKGLVLLATINDNVPKTMFTDSVRIYQILSNLISNAIKYSGSGQIILEIEYDDEEHGIKFNVNDQGLGIQKEDIACLFKEYKQTSNNNKINNINSNGLGLCVSQRIANLLGGYITVRNKIDKGSVFTLFHPIKLGLSGSFNNIKKYASTLEGKILIVDDDNSNLILLRMLFDNFNYDYGYNFEVHYADDGKGAIEIANIINFDLILMDINMPNIDGCTASKIIRNNGYAGYIIATTGNILAKKENQESHDKYKYFNEIIIKPYDDQILLKLLNKYLSD